MWAYSEANAVPESGPYDIPFADQKGYLTIRERLQMPGPLDAVAENALDVPHTAFVHSGLFRKDANRQPIEVVIRAIDGGVEAQYIGEQRPAGVAGRILAPQGGEVLARGLADVAEQERTGPASGSLGRGPRASVAEEAS